MKNSHLDFIIALTNRQEQNWCFIEHMPWQVCPR